MNIVRRGLMLVLSSPSGAGKTTIAKSLLKQDKNLKNSVSVTTRSKRPSEENGRDYFFFVRCFPASSEAGKQRT